MKDPTQIFQINLKGQTNMAKKVIFGFPIIVPWLSHYYHENMQKNCLLDICSASKKIKIGDKLIGVVVPEIILYNSPQLFPKIEKYYTQPQSLWKARLLTISFDVQTIFNKILSEIESSKTSFDEDEKRRFAEKRIADCFEMHLDNLLLLGNLLFPGALSCAEGFVLMDGSLIGKTSPLYNDAFIGVIETVRKIKWPKFCKVSFVKAWSWLNRSGCIQEGVGIGSLGRAWAAFSHVTTRSHEENSSIDLIWLLLGLEAIFQEGNTGLKKQLVTKTEALLGRKDVNKKAFGAIYDFRSRFLHGDFDFPIKFTQYDGAEKYEKYHKELFEHGSLALAVLIATLQIMARHGWYKLDFKYKVLGYKIKGKSRKLLGTDC